MLVRSGSPSAKNMTPRGEKDTVGEPGAAPGLSLSADDAEIEAGKPYQLLDVSKLPSGLACYDDDPDEPGGRAGHSTIVPVDAFGSIDEAELERWSKTREDASPDKLTAAVILCITKSERKPKT